MYVHIISIKMTEKHIFYCHKFEEYSPCTLFIKQTCKSRSIMFFYHFLKCQRRCLISIILHLECYIHQNCYYWYVDMICHVSKKINKKCCGWAVDQSVHLACCIRTGSDGSTTKHYETGVFLVAVGVAR